MINAIAIDDEPPALQLITHFCKQSGMVDLKRTFTDGEEALRFLKKFPVDLVFLDIQMPAMLGTELRQHIGKEKAIVFTTAYSHYAAECFDLDATDYLLKPYSLERFVAAIEKVKFRLSNQLQLQDEETAHIMLRADYSLMKIVLKDILYIEGLEDYSKIFYKDDTLPMIFRITLKALLEKLPEQDFLRVHRSFIVRTDAVEKLRSNTLYLPGDVEVPIGRLYKEQTVEYFKKLLKED